MALGLGFLGRMFGTEKAMDTIVGGLVKGLDSLVYTKEEKAADAAKDRAAGRAMLIEWMDKTQGQSIARRFLALMIAFVWLSQYMLSVTFGLVGVWVTSPETIAQLDQAAALTSANAQDMNAPMMLILGFYFAAPHLDKFVAPIAAKMMGKTDAQK